MDEHKVHKMVIPVVRNNNNAQIPVRKTLGCAGYDLFAVEDTVIFPQYRQLIDTSISISIPPGYYGKIEARSSFALDYIDVGAGVIDSDYRGTIKVLLINNRIPGLNSHLQIKTGMRIAQLIIMKHETPLFEDAEVGKLDETDRDVKGFGSTGKY